MGATLKTLAQHAGATLRGDADKVVERASALEGADAESISFLTGKRYLQHLKTTRAAAVILSPEFVDECPVDCLVSDNPYLAYARVATVLHPPPRPAPGIHPRSHVEPSARIAESASVGPNAVIGANVTLGERVIIGPGCIVLDDAVVGDDSHLVAMVTLTSETQLGQRCLIHPGTVIGSDGFGNANDHGAWVKVPQLGRVVVGDDVEIGACTAIDRGALGDTVIGDGVRIDNQVHIAHNVVIGEHTAMAGCTAIAGSSKIGAYCTLAGKAAVTGHVELADRVHVSGMTAVTRTITTPGVYTGMMPAMDHAEWSKNFARIRHLDKLTKRVRSLERELAALRDAE